MIRVLFLFVNGDNWLKNFVSICEFYGVFMSAILA